MADHKQDGWLTAPLPAGEPAEMDTSVAHPARVYGRPGRHRPPDGVSAYGGVARKP